MSSTAAAVAGRHRAVSRTAVAPQGTTPRRKAVPARPVVRRSVPRRLLGWTGNGLLLVGVLAFLLIAVGPHLFGYRTATMLTGSMEPGIMPGDVVVTVPKPAGEIAVGDVISYQIPIEDHRVETHRVTKVIHHRDGTIAVQTKGDANDNVDPWTATLQQDTVWEMKAVVPKLGSAIRVLRSPAFQHGIFWVALGGLLVVGVSTIWGKEPDEDAPAQDEAAAA
jgi:signal peptidase